MQQQELIPHLFRTESGRITAVLCRIFGFDQVELAEDITSDTFLRALETWPYKGIPPNPVAWLHTVARHKAINHLKREKIFQSKIAHHLKDEFDAAKIPEPDFSQEQITDSQLQMLFAICDPALPDESQIALALRILCGFGIDEIAHAFLSNKDVIYKRIFRAKEKLREARIESDFSALKDVENRLINVLRSLYLLFNEGYYSETHDSLIREDLCFEAIRLTALLIESARTNTPPTNALLALMCFHASRFPARRNAEGRMVLYEDQDESLWDQNLIARGVYYFKQSSGGSDVSRYHLEAGIAYWHTQKSDSAEKWENVLRLYNHLLVLEYSPIAALNRTYALYKVKGAVAAILEAEKLKLNENPYYFTLLGVLYKEQDPEKSAEHFRKALLVAKTKADREAILSHEA